MSKRKAEALQDEQIVCKDCSSAFTFTVREQTAFAAKGFPAQGAMRRLHEGEEGARIVSQRP